MEKIKGPFILFLLALLLTAIEYFLIAVALPWMWFEIYQGSVFMMTLIMLTIIGCFPMFAWMYLTVLVGWYSLGSWLALVHVLFNKNER